MQHWVLILMINSQYELLSTYSSEVECEKAAIKMVDAGYAKQEQVLAGCYQLVSATSGRLK